VAAAARMLLDYHGIYGVSEAELRRILKTKPRGTHIFNLIYLKDEKRWNLDVEVYEGTPNELFAKVSTTRVPVIAFVDTEPLPHWDESMPHVVVVVGYDEESVIINDPFFNEEERRIPIAQFLKAWELNENYMIVIKKKKD
jgi:ABC-type bacteriocin/lantibiotic exporter with double-glycine peptidase domain